MTRKKDSAEELSWKELMSREEIFSGRCCGR